MQKLRATRAEISDAVAALELSMEHGWGDGLPIIPPTPRLVQAMIDGCGLDADFSLGPVPPVNREATVERLAINAVMAGCRPDYFPVVLAVIEAVLDPEYNLPAVSLTTHQASPIVIVNGPVRTQIGMNCGTGVFGPGNRANATIGRTLRLTLQTLGGSVPGVTMSMLSSPERYTFCFPEDEETSPWQPLHVDRGLAPGTSAVTVACGESTWITQTPMLWDRGARFVEIAGTLLTDMGGMPPRNGNSQPLIVLQSGQAARFEKQGISKEDLRHLIFERSRVPTDKVKDWKLFRDHPGMPALDWEGYVRPTDDPQGISIVVTGGRYPGHAAIIPGWPWNHAVTKEIRLP